MFHIVFLSPHSDPEARLGEVDAGGQCIYEFELAKNLSQIPDTKVTIYCRKKFGHQDVSVVSDTFSIKRIECGGEEFIPKEQLYPYIDEFAIAAAQDLRQDPPNILHGHYWDGAKASLLIYKYLRMNVPVVWTPHALAVPKKLKFAGVANEILHKFIPRIAWESYAVLFSDGIIVSTDNEKKMLLDDYHCHNGHIAIIPPGISQDNFTVVDKMEARKKYGIPEDVINIVSYGRATPTKGYHNTIRAFAELKKVAHINAMLSIFTGSETSVNDEEVQYLKSLRALAAELGVDKDILFHDSVPHDEVKNILSASDVYVNLADYEYFGITVLEAMYMKLPVVVTTSGGPKNIITHTVNGMLVSPTDYRRAAYDILSVIRDKRIRDRLTTNARALIEEKYTWKVRAALFYDHYINLKPLSDHSYRTALLKDIQL
jgi:glycosyltransferase involved in cell wall biosynthesis